MKYRYTALAANFSHEPNEMFNWHLCKGFDTLQEAVDAMPLVKRCDYQIITVEDISTGLIVYEWWFGGRLEQVTEGISKLPMANMFEEHELNLKEPYHLIHEGVWYLGVPTRYRSDEYKLTSEAA